MRSAASFTFELRGTGRRLLPPARPFAPSLACRFMRAAAIALAAAAAVLGPAGSDWHLAVPSAPRGILGLFEDWVRAPARSAERVGHDEESPPACLCSCPPTEGDRHDPSVLGWAFAAGVAAWPAADVARLIKLAWQRRVASAERALQLRAPDRP